MSSIFENVSTRMFCVYGELSDVFCMPDTRIFSFEEMLVRRLEDMGYDGVVFCSTQRNIFYAIDGAGTNCFKALKGSNNKTPPAETSSAPPPVKPSKSKFEAALSNGSKTAATAPSANDKNNTSYIEEGFKHEQLAAATNMFMCDTSSSKVLVFNSIEDIIKISNEESGRRLLEYFEEWKALPNENRNICIFLSKTLGSSDLQSLLHDNKNAVLESLFVRNNIFNNNACLNIGAPLNDEIENLLEHFRISGYTYRNAENTEIKAKLMFHHTNDELMTLVRTLSFYNRENGYTQLKDMKEVIEKYIRDSGTYEVWITPDQIKHLYPDSSAEYKDEEDPLEKLNNTEGWEPAYNVIKSYMESHQLLYGDRIIEAPEQDRYELTTDRFSGSVCNSAFRGKAPNFVLQGPPGVGKTEIAKLIGRILQKEGVLKSGHTVVGTRDKLVGQYVGSTSIRTAELIDEAQEGVLLVDEVYAIADKNGEHNVSFCDEVFNTIVAAMTNPNYHFCVIFAGYASRMHEVWNMNEGLFSRFSTSNVITINEYQPELLQKIFVGQFGKPEGTNGLVTHLSEDVLESLPVFFRNFYDDRDRKDFGNARDINNLVSDVKRNANDRHLWTLRNKQTLTSEDRLVIKVEKCDFGDRMCLFNKRGLSTKDIFGSLNDYVGLDFLADMFNDQLALRVECREKGLEYAGPSHMIWAGNPGTGKSTAAQLIAGLYHDLGILGGTSPVYADASEFLSTYTSGGSQKMNEKIDEACQKNAVLVIEEAYQLLTCPDSIHALLNRMEIDRRNFNLVLILYKDMVEEFLRCNSGLSSRLRIYEFPDYDGEQLYLIFEKMCSKMKDDITPECKKAVKVLLENLYRNGNTKYGNARLVRQIHDLMRQKRYHRINRTLVQLTGIDINTIAAARATDDLHKYNITIPEELKLFQVEDVPLPDEYAALIVKKLERS